MMLCRDKTRHMSRSYRKPWIKDGGHGRKKSHARAMRSRVRQITHHFKTTTPPEWRLEYWLAHPDLEWEYATPEYIKIFLSSPDEPVYPHKYDITHAYDMCDYRWMTRYVEYTRK